MCIPSLARHNLSPILNGPATIVRPGDTLAHASASYPVLQIKECSGRCLKLFASDDPKERNLQISDPAEVATQ